MATLFWWLLFPWLVHLSFTFHFRFNYFTCLFCFIFCNLFCFFVFFKPAYLVITLHLKWKPKQPVGLCIKLEKKKNPFLFHINQQNPNPPFLFSLKSQPFFVTISRFKISTIFYCFQFHFYSISSIWSFYKRTCLFFIEEYVFINDSKLSLHTHFLSKLRVWNFFFSLSLIFLGKCNYWHGFELESMGIRPFVLCSRGCPRLCRQVSFCFLYTFLEVFLLLLKARKFPFWEVLCGFNENLRFMWQKSVMLST